MFGARTTRLVDGELHHDATAGVELAATYVRDGFSSKLGLEAGRTFYTVLDERMPDTTGFAVSLGLTIQAAGGHTWER